MAIGEMIAGVAGNLISSFLEKTGNKLLYEIRKNTLLENINKLIDKYVKNNDGTIIVTGEFETFIIYQKPIEKIFDYILKTTIHTTDDEFINALIDLLLRNKDILINRMREPFVYYLILAARKYSQEINNVNTKR